MIAIDNLSKSYGNQILFEEVHFQINARERVGLVGRNGHGVGSLGVTHSETVGRKKKPVAVCNGGIR